MLQQGDLEEAIICYREAIKIDATLADAHALLGVAFVKDGQITEAIAAWQQALKIKPDQINALRGLAWVLATAPDESLRNGTRAVALAQRATELSGGDNPVLMRTLAAAYDETGRFGDAIATAGRALELAVAQHNGAVSAKLSQEIKLYEANTPMRDAPQ